MFESLFTFLFKYQRLVFEQGKFVLRRHPFDVAAVPAVAAAALYVLWTYRQVAALPARVARRA